jgi:hypothetical protein
MRASTRRVLTLGIVLTTAFVWSGCEAKKQTEFVTGVSTQVKVPRDLKAIRVDVSVGGVIKFCQGYRVYDGKVQLPRSLGEFPQSGSPGPDPITVTVSGYTEEFSESSDRPVFSDCPGTAPVVGGKDQPNTRILRRSRQPYVADTIRFLPMPLKYSCFDTTCPDESTTCKAGLCVDAVEVRKLPLFTEDLLTGLGSTCFNASQCFAAASPAVVVDPEDCTYALPNTPPSSPDPVAGAPPNPFPKSGDGVNVEITYDGGVNREILDKDEAEGFFIPDAVGLPQRFRLGPGLCGMVKGVVPVDAAHPDGLPKHRITAVRVSGTCQAKSPFQPLCANDQLAAMGVDASGISGNATPPSGCNPTALLPPKAALVILADDTQNSSIFFSPASLKQTLGVSLGDPAFQKTEIGLQFFPGPGTCATPGSFTLAVQPELAVKAKTDIFMALTAEAGMLKPMDGAVNLDGALNDAYALLGQPKYSAYYRRAVLVLGNRDFDKSTCGETPADRASAAKSVHNIETYVLLLARNTSIPDATVPVPGTNELAVAGATSGAYDARANKAPAQDAFQAVVNDLATCVYDVEGTTARPQSGDMLSYTNPIDIAAKTTTIAFNAACSAEGVAGEGFGVDPGNASRTYLCKSSCDAYRNVLHTASLYAAQYSQPAIAVPVFAHKQGCPIAASGGFGSVTP